MQTVVIGMSGGVDSSVAAYLLKNQGYNVIGLFMVNWKDDGVCTAKEDYEDVKRVCNAISIPYFSVNYSKEYYENVFEYFLQEYKKGRTPNPDVLCNREIKFKPFLEHAKKLGADYIATGHYAKVFEKNGLFYLAKAKDLSKDQSYFLNQLSQEQLKNVIFPLAEIEKKQVREIAKKLCLSTATKKDSTGICFVGERNFKNFLKNFIPAQPGEIRTINEKVVGKHEGLMFYTLGQRRGLGIGGRADGTGERWFVFKKDLEKNVLYVSQGEGKELFSSGLTATGFNWIPKIPKNEKKLEIGKKKNFCNEQINKEGANENTEKKMQSCFTAKEDEIEFECFAKFRYRQPDQKVKIFVTSSTTIKIEFENKQRAITPGQFVVLYDENGVCLGGGEIENAF